MTSLFQSVKETFLQLLWPQIIPLICIFLILLFVPCFLNLLSWFVSSQINKIQTQLLMQQGYNPLASLTTSSYHSHLDGH